MQAARIETIDVVRGFAVLGILLMNIAGFALVNQAYVSPAVMGHETPAAMGMWFATAVLVDGKMRALFAMLFGASLILMAGDKPGREAWRGHLARMAVLLVIGMVHAWLVWHGDILVPYAIAGTIIFAFRRLPARGLLVLGAILLALQAMFNASGGWQASLLEAAATASGATAGDVAAWRGMEATTRPPAADVARELAAFRGGWAEVQAMRAELTRTAQTFLLPLVFLLETLGFMALGMALFRAGFWQGNWPTARYRALALVALPLGWAVSALMASFYRASGFAPDQFFFGVAVNNVTAPLIATGYAAILILVVKAGRAPALMGRLGAAGRMALTNYLMSSILMTTLFYGTGFGLFGTLDRAQLLLPVLVTWALILAWSKPWLAHFHQGPFEWLWRTVARWQVQPFRRVTV
jgi:uncharacterized protein